MSGERREALPLSVEQALGVALSVQAETMLMEEAQERAPAMLEHLRALGYDVTALAAEPPGRCRGGAPMSRPMAFALGVLVGVMVALAGVDLGLLS